MSKVILSLCDHSGVWSQPYENAGYDVIVVDIRHGNDVRLIPRFKTKMVHGILASPPCTHFSKAGAWMWEVKGEAAVLDGLSIVDACLRAVAIYRPEWWALENPVGRLRTWLGPPDFRFDPCDYGDPWTKKTYLWGDFCPPIEQYSQQARNRVEPVTFGGPGARKQRDLTTQLGARQRHRRSITPPGFAQAFFEANP